MKKLLFVLSCACLIFACSKTDQDLTTPTVDALSEEFDNSNFGNYKGVFTTLDSETRATVDVSITPDGAAATLTTEAGLVHELYSLTEIIQGEATNVVFEGNEGSFNFEVDGDGENVAITEVVYLDKPSDILMKKNTAKAPANPITGTYNCTNCESGQDADAHTHFTDNAITETFSFVFSGTTGSGTIATQITYDGTVHSTGSGNEGALNVNGVTGSTIVEDNDASDNIVSIGGTSTVIANVDWEGVHDFDGISSFIYGVWDFETGGYIMTGAFQATEALMFGLPFTENFDINFDGIRGDCNESSNIYDCGIVRLPSNRQWTITGNPSGLTADSDYVRTVDHTDGNSKLEWQDTDKELCFQTELIDISAASTVDFSVELISASGNDNTSAGGLDYADINIIIDNNLTMIPNWNNEGSTAHTLVGNFGIETVTTSGLNGSTLRIQICGVTTTGSERITVDNISVTAN